LSARAVRSVSPYAKRIMKHDAFTTLAQPQTALQIPGGVRMFFISSAMTRKSTRWTALSSFWMIARERRRTSCPNQPMHPGTSFPASDTPFSRARHRIDVHGLRDRQPRRCRLTDRRTVENMCAENDANRLGIGVRFAADQLRDYP
jgi:hypothetical protein